MPASVSLAVELGLYQSYIGLAVLLIIMLLFKMVMDNTPWKSVGRQVFDFFVGGVSGCVLYLVIMKIDLKLHHLTPASRAASFSLKTILISLPRSIIDAYEKWGMYFQDKILHRNIIYIFIFILLIAFIGFIFMEQLKQHQYINLFVMFLLLLVIPIGANIVGIMIPSFQIYLLMQYQYVLIIPFAIMLIEHIDLKNKIIVSGKMLFYILVGIITWTYLISANATYRCYKMSYDHINFETSLVLSDIYDLADYVPSETRIIFAGFPNADTLYENVSTYKYAIHYVSNPVFWTDMNGAYGNRYWYLMNYFGVNGGFFSYEEYDGVIYSDEFYDMPLWPAEGSVKMINGFAVVKFTDNPPATSTMPN